MQSSNFNPNSRISNINTQYKAQHRRTSSFPTTTLTTQSRRRQQDLYHAALERSTTLSTRTPLRPNNTGAIPSYTGTAPSSYLDVSTPDYLYYYYYYNQTTMPTYPVDIPAYAGHSSYYYPQTTASRAIMPPARSPSNHYSQLPTMKPQPAIPESFIHKTFRDFADHAYRCAVCFDPLRVHLEGRQLCSKGHKLARKVSKALYEEANEKYRRSTSSRRRPDGWQAIEVDIPKGCEVVRALLNAMERGLDIHSRSSDNVPSTPVTPARTHFDDSMYTHYQRRSGPSSDEELYRARPRHRDEPEARRSRSTKRSSSVGNAGRKPVVIGIPERDRRPYGASHSSNGSVDSGYDTAPGSPDIRRGSQYHEDMKRRKDRPKSILKKSISFEREQLLEKVPQTPRSPTKGSQQEKYVVFNISGECLAPGYD